VLTRSVALYPVKRQLDNAVTAVESLSDRIGVVVQYLRQVQSGMLVYTLFVCRVMWQRLLWLLAGAVKPDPATLRQLSALCARLPVTTDDATFESHAETVRPRGPLHAVGRCLT
jgi:hypothetical protein